MKPHDEEAFAAELKVMLEASARILFWVGLAVAAGIVWGIYSVAMINLRGVL